MNTQIHRTTDTAKNNEERVSENIMYISNNDTNYDKQNFTNWDNCRIEMRSFFFLFKIMSINTECGQITGELCTQLEYFFVCEGRWRGKNWIHMLLKTAKGIWAMPVMSQLPVEPPMPDRF
jgi:hypothetical protein